MPFGEDGLGQFMAVFHPFRGEEYFTCPLHPCGVVAAWAGGIAPEPALGAVDAPHLSGVSRMDVPRCGAVSSGFRWELVDCLHCLLRALPAFGRTTLDRLGGFSVSSFVGSRTTGNTAILYATRAPRNIYFKSFSESGRTGTNQARQATRRG